MAMGKDDESFYERMLARGLTRRDFLKFCGVMGFLMGLKQTGVAQVVDALQTKPRKPVIWLHFQECTCCSESFLRSAHPLVSEVLFDMISLCYSDTLMAAAGFQAETLKAEAIKKYYGKYILLVEGAIPYGSDGYCTIAGRSAAQQFKEAAAGAEAIIAWGNCASSGCIQAARPNPTQAKPVHQIFSGKPIINVQGCPPIADVMAGVIVYMLTFNRVPELDGLGRPLMFYGRRIHDTCYRRPCYDAGLFVESFDDENAKKGYCLYKMGCRGPNTFNSCAVIKWNNNVSYPIQSGHGCIGCAEPNFWDHGPFYQHLPDTNGFGINATADQIGAALTGVTVAGTLVHAVATNFAKRKLIENEMTDVSLNETEAQEDIDTLNKKIDDLKSKMGDEPDKPKDN